MTWVAKELELRLMGGRTEDEGRLEVRFDRGPWGVICGDGWGVREAMVACRQLGIGPFVLYTVVPTE
jgi:lysyl oxidase-like protein 2/3/4